MSSGIVEPPSSGSQGPEGQQTVQQNPSRSRLVQRLLNASSALPAFVQDLITTQAVVVSGTEAAGFIIQKAENNGISLQPVAHVRPDNASEDIRQQALQAFVDILRPCVQQGKDGAIEVAPATTGDAEAQYCLVTLLRNEGAVVAVSAVITRCRDIDRAQQRLNIMQLVAGYFDLYTLRQSSGAARVAAQNHQHALQLAGAVGATDGFEHSARAFCNELATRTGSTRVSLGWVKGTRIKVVALSHTEHFDKKQDVVVNLEKVMEESLDQEEVVQFDPDGQTSSSNVTRAAAAFSRTQGNIVVLSLPIRSHTDIVGVVTLEFDTKKRLTPQAAEGLAIAVDLIGPPLHDRYQNDRWLITKIGISTRETAKLALGPKHMLPKSIIIASLALIAFVAFYRPMYHVAAPFTFASVDRRVICAPYDGHIGELGMFTDANGQPVSVRAGLHVNKGDLLMSLDTSELKKKKADADSRALSYRRQADKAFADKTDDRSADGLIAQAQAQAAQAEADLYAYQIEHSKVIAPFDGEILKCEVEDKKGAPVKTGDTLFEIAKKDKLKVEINVADRDVQWVRPGATGELATSSLPGETHQFKVDHVVPLGEAKDGKNVFTVYGVLDKESDPSTGWRPGLGGEVRIDVEHRSLAWIWTHRLVDFVRLYVWM